MSYTYVRLVLRSTLPRPKKLVCVAIADHVDKFGKGCYVSYGTLAEETSYEERQVMRIVTELEQDGIIVYQGKHPEYDTNVWNIDKDKLPRLPARQTKRAREAVMQPPGNESEPEDVGQPHRDESELDDAAIEAFWASIGERIPGSVTSGGDRSDVISGSDISDVTAAAAASDVTLGSDNSGQEGVTLGGFGPWKMSPNPSSEKGRGKQEKKGPGGKQALPPALDARVNPAAKTRVLRERADSATYPDEVDEIRARDRPETALQTKIAQLTHSRYLSASQKSRLRGGVTAAWGESKLPVTHPSPEDEWAAHPDLFAEYVELCARRIREESGRPPSRDKLVQSVRNYARYNTGWLDFRKAAQEERRQAQQRAHPSAKQNQWYYDPSKPDWMQ
jgi:hypothetical protein